ncbi:unnamed protein product [Rhodiola kirilowii]
MGDTIKVYGLPATAKKETLTRFLESHTGQGTVVSVKLEKGRRKQATVKFLSRSFAEQIVNLLNESLCFEGSYLKVWLVDSTIVLNPETSVQNVDFVRLHLGCQVKANKFCAFWSAVNVSISFGLQQRRFCFFLSYLSKCYKLELPYVNIWQMQLRRPREFSSRYLLIQLYGSPYIYEQNDAFKNTYTSLETIPDKGWVRTADFTPSMCLGQSSSICLEILHGKTIPNFRQHFVFFKEIGGPFELEYGSTFSDNTDIVPVISSPRHLDLPFDILFKANCLVQNGCLPGPALDANFFNLIDPGKHDISYIEKALETLYHMKECCYDPVKWLTEQYNKYKKARRPLKTVAIALNAGLINVRRVQITPTKVYFCGPEPIVSNRVLRHYQNDIDNFLRVSFVDEDGDKLYSTALIVRAAKEAQGSFTSIYERLIHVLKNGLNIGGKKFEFLAFSSSQLRENSCWMFASRPGLTAINIRNWMGNFHKIRNVAKYAARLGQSFGSSTETLSVPHKDVAHIHDVELRVNGREYNFSDGIGKISPGFANKVATKCHIKGRPPSAFQIRYGGYKGVVAVDPEMTGSVKLALRPSMCKYESTNIKLDVLSWSKSQHCHLNRQLITLLSTLGIQDFIFERKQKEIINQLDTIVTDRLKACEILDTFSSGEITHILKEMLMVGYKPDAEPFLSRMLKTLRDYKLMELRYKSRIYIEKGRALMGCLDETRTLVYGQVFVQYSHHNSKRGRSIAKGKLIVAKNPCLHPGDIRILEAVDAPSLRHMVDCVVFPQKGMRPHPNECSGSDLDGDIYFVCWDPDLIPNCPFSPMDYAPAPSVLLDHDVTIEEVEEYFVNYMVNDSLGIIANTHTAFADQSENKAMSNECVQLAELFSVAVDFPKTGAPAVIPANLHAKEYPDFMEKPVEACYKSPNVIGKLYREVKSITDNSQYRKYFSLADALESYDRDMEVEGFENYIDDAFYFKDSYDRKLRDLMAYYKIKREAEIISGNIMSFVKSFKKKRDAEAISEAVKSLREEARGWFNEKSISNRGPDDPYAKASAWYYVTYHPNCWEYYDEVLEKHEHQLSFPWCVYDKLLHIKKDKMKRGQSSHMSQLEQHFASLHVL